MCGITGYRVVKADARPWATRLPNAVQSLHHRGPDDEGIWFDPEQRVGLGHRRLSILDLSARGHQPMVSACGNWHIVFNGEVYNFAALRGQLESLGHRFASSGDSEVLLAAFAQWGPDAVSRFIGMFAIALWHAPTRRLHLVRDRLGVKPLYYRWDGQVLCFGSELKALRAFDAWQPAIDREALIDYLRYGYIADPRTIYEQVCKLPPAHRLVLDEHGGLELHRYWNVLDHVGRRNDRSEDALADELEALMIDAFNDRMIADVPVGIFLSGGIDSSAVAAILQKHGGQRIKTFTIGFDLPDYDESVFARDVARHLGTEHHCRMLRADDARRLLPRWGDFFDEPFGDESGLATFLVSQVAAEQVKVVLSADGGDELFAGYTSYAAALRQWDQIRNVPLGLRRMAAVAINRCAAAQIDRHLEARGAAAARLVGPAFSALAKVGARVGARGVGEIFDRAVAHFDDRELANLVGDDVATRERADRYPGEAGEQLCLWDLQHYLPGDVLTKVDRATMAVSIEGREPLLDHRLVEFAFALPFGLRRGRLGAKHLLKKVLYRHVPQALVDRPKRGFAIPVKDWLTTELRGLVDEHLDSQIVARQGLFDPAMVRRYVRRLHAGDVSVRQRVWLLLAFQLWHARWMSAPARG